MIKFILDETNLSYVPDENIFIKKITKQIFWHDQRSTNNDEEQIIIAKSNLEHIGHLMWS